MLCNDVNYNAGKGQNVTGKMLRFFKLSLKFFNLVISLTGFVTVN